MTEERLVSLDTETTGLDPETGDRIVEIGCVELVNHMPTGRKLHLYINPERDVPAEAFKVHGLSNEFLDDKPVFAEVVDEFIDFIGDARLVIHNAEFDMKFINAELVSAGKDALPKNRAIDTLRMAREKFPGAAASLNALCRKFEIPLDNRVLHGALLDAELLGDVWLGLNGGRQHGMSLESEGQKSTGSGGRIQTARQRPYALASRLTSEDMVRHQSVMTSVEAAAQKSSKGQISAIWAPEPADSDPAPM